MTTQQTVQSNQSSPWTLLFVKCSSVTEKFRPKPVDTNTLILTVKSLNQTRSVGSDGILLKFIKDALYFIASYLPCVINGSNVTGVFPQAWKNACVVPLLKKGDFNDSNNYRPVPFADDTKIGN